MLATTDLRTEYEVLGMVKGSTKAKHLGKDIVAGLRKIVGGDVKNTLSCCRVETRLSRMVPG